MSASFWDERYSGEGYFYGELPNEFLMEMAEIFPVGCKVFLPGDGEGRNSVWLAKRGFRVTAVDSSEQGVAKARALAQKSDVNISYEVACLENWTYPKAEFDVAALIYMHLPNSIRREVHRKIAASVKPGGILLVECFHPDQLRHSSGGPKQMDMLYDVDALLKDFEGLLASRFEYEGEMSLAEGLGHQGVAHITRWIGSRLP